MRKTVYWIEGDGIGPEVWKSARPVIDEAIRLSYGDERGFDWKELLAGEKALKETGTLLPDVTLAGLRGAELATALNDFAWELEAQDDAHASATFRRHLVRQLGAQVIAQVTETSR